MSGTKKGRVGRKTGPAMNGKQASELYGIPTEAIKLLRNALLINTRIGPADHSTLSLFSAIWHNDELRALIRSTPEKYEELTAAEDAARFAEARWTESLRGHNSKIPSVNEMMKEVKAQLGITPSPWLKRRLQQAKWRAKKGVRPDIP